MSKLQKDQEKVLEDEAKLARPMQLRSLPAAAAAPQRRVLAPRSSSTAEEKAR